MKESAIPWLRFVERRGFSPAHAAKHAMSVKTNSALGCDVDRIGLKA
jgi:hypothetical protein